MLGVLATLLVTLGCVGVGKAIAGRWMATLDPAARFGLGGLVGLGTLGTLTFVLGYLPGGLNWGVFVVGLYALTGLGLLARDRAELKMGKPEGLNLLFPLAIAVFSLFVLVSVLAPSLMEDWDTLAYHLAVPKQWIAAGHMFQIPSTSHSAFPEVIDDLYVWGLTWGDQYGAKAFSLSFFLVGIIAIFGLSRKQYGSKAGWWAALSFASVPAVLWEAGTGYIDVGNGLYSGLGLALCALAFAKEEDRSLSILGAILLGFGAASKYTGLETIFIAAFLLLVMGALRKQAASGFRAAVLVALVAGVIASPWYIRNVVNTGNPVYPFKYETLGGKDWDQRRAEAYANEQQSFGVGQKGKGKDPMAIGHGVLGLAYQPGRYVNPGQQAGLGMPTGAVGISILAALVLWPLSGRRRRFESFLLAGIGITLFAWYLVVSEQSRYIIGVAPPLAILLGGAVVELTLGQLAAGLTVLQALYSLWLFQSSRFSDQIQVVTGKISAADYQARGIPFYGPAQAINGLKPGKVAMYDDVFGFLLDVPYMWANPGHSTIIPYDSMRNGDDYVREMKRLGFTHAYIDTASVVWPVRKDLDAWLDAMALDPETLQTLRVNPESAAWTPQERDAKFADWQAKWQVLLADAVATHKMTVVQAFPRGVLFKFE